MGLDFKRASDLFMGTPEELARALGIDEVALHRHRSRPDGVPEAVLVRLAAVLEERGRAMVRVAELLRGD